MSRVRLQPPTRPNHRRPTSTALPHTTYSSLRQTAQVLGNRRFMAYMQRFPADWNTQRIRQYLQTVTLARSTPNFNIIWQPPTDPQSRTATLRVVLRVHYEWDYRGYPRNQVPPNERWTALEQNQYQQDFAQAVSRAWSSKYQLACQTRGLDDLRANVQVEVINQPTRHDAHYRVQVFKSPSASQRLRSSVDQGNRHAQLDYRDPTVPATFTVYKRPLRSWQLGPYPYNKYAVSGPIRAQTDAIHQEMTALEPRTAIEYRLRGMRYVPRLLVIGRTSTSGSQASNKALGRRRAQAVRAYLTQQGGKTWRRVKIEVGSAGKTGMRFAAESRRVEILFYPNYDDFSQAATQNTAAHEAGHMFGLDDEYKDAKDRRMTGDTPTHYNDVLQQLGREEAEKTRVLTTDSIMAAGSDVLAGHYVPFIKALEEVTRLDWTIKR